MKQPVDTEYVFVRKSGKVFYPDNVAHAAYRIPLSEALKKGYTPSKSFEKYKER
jgi:hypothetical protein